MKRRVLVIGVGLIGGSLALAIKKEHEDIIIGYDLNREECELAEKLNVIDETTTDLQASAEEADLIIFATPVEQTLQLMDQMSGYQFKQDVILTDVGSTKAVIMRHAQAFHQKGIVFIGGHPMAGSHKTGVASAKGHLFENAFYILTLLPGTPAEKIDQLKEWLKGTKGNFQVMDPEEHDHVTGVVSHFPHVMAASLVRQVQNQSETHGMVNRLAAGGFRDITRIASSSPTMWRDIITHNRENILTLLDEWMIEMKEVRRMVEDGKRDVLHDYFSSAKKYRDTFPANKKGAIQSFHDLYVDVIDHVGVISQVTGLLADANISITNVGIIEAREDVYGVLRLSFRTEADRKRAKACLEHHNFDTYLAL
ncbi:prephenate dehydrogenase [Pseudalkalibacillus sp. SCS-8]|uniref:prephenate dehydrogenase n=1 Tax=Pseudalkalibacillus nanhaiensis TaxID=3115291 RepID=UPI0032DADC62